jgi:branched-chain amino acid transport system permease protein
VTTSRRLAASSLGALACVAIPLLVPTFYVALSTEILILALFAVSLNLLMGYGGMTTFGHAAYFGLGGYAAAILVTKARFPMLAAFICAPFVAAAAAALFGFFCVRLRRIYFAMLTLAFAQIAYTVISIWYSFTNGDNGITDVWPMPVLATSTAYYYFALALVAASIGSLHRIVHSPFGYALQAIREDARRTEFIGINVRLYQWLAFVTAGFFAGVAGALFTFLKGGVFPDYLFWARSADPIIMSVLGGMRYFAGPIVGTAVFELLRFSINRYTEYWLLCVGGILILCILLAPRGLVGLAADVMHSRRLRDAR